MPGPSRDSVRGFVGIVSAEIWFAENSSLKEKRMHLRRMRDHLLRRHGVAFAEVGYQDLWQRAHIVCSLAASDIGNLENRMDALVTYLDEQDWQLARVHEEVVEVDG